MLRVTPLLTAEMQAPLHFFKRPSGPLWQLRGLTGERVYLPIPAFLVEHPQHGPLLIDTGISSEDNIGIWNRLSRLRARKPVDEHLRERGIDPTDIGLVVFTHLHYDHSSGLHLLPGAEAVVDRDELAAARRGRFTEGYNNTHFDEGRRWVEISGEHDVFGDGSLMMVPTPGHTVGHHSILCQLDGRKLLLTGDAAYATRTIDHDELQMFLHDDTRFRESLAWLRRWREEHPGDVVICGHDPWSWPDLETTYA